MILSSLFATSRHETRRLMAASVVCAGVLAGATPASAIVGGELVQRADEARRFTVKVESSRGELCSGVAITERIVLTAAHCVMRGGRFTVSALDQQMRRTPIAVAQVMAHESFLPGLTPSTQPGIDLAMLLLAGPLPPGTTPVTLGGAIGPGDGLTIAGFGLGQENRRQTARTLRQTTLTTAGAYTSANSVVVAVDNEKLGQFAGAGACKGDSGGPILRGGRSSTELVGIISWSSGPLNQRLRSVCGGFTAITPVADHRAWITATAAALAAMPTATVEALSRANRRGPVATPASIAPDNGPPMRDSDGAR